MCIQVLPKDLINLCRVRIVFISGMFLYYGPIPCNCKKIESTCSHNNETVWVHILYTVKKSRPAQGNAIFSIYVLYYKVITIDKCIRILYYEYIHSLITGWQPWIFCSFQWLVYYKYVGDLIREICARVIISVVDSNSTSVDTVKRLVDVVEGRLTEFIVAEFHILAQIKLQRKIGLNGTREIVSGS